MCFDIEVWCMLWKSANPSCSIVCCAKHGQVGLTQAAAPENLEQIWAGHSFANLSQQFGGRVKRNTGVHC